MIVRPEIKTRALRIAIYWIIVLIPLLWGVYQSIVKSLPLFSATADSKDVRDSVNR